MSGEITVFHPSCDPRFRDDRTCGSDGHSRDALFDGPERTGPVRSDRPGLQFSLQAKCLAHASAQMRASERRFLTVEGDAPFRPRFGPFRHHIFKRHYVIATGTGYGDWFE
jgi:hypothetical protein